MELSKPKQRQRGRPISFDKGLLVKSVMEKFWHQGYQQVSLNEIAKDNGLTRASLYHSFTSKESLFLQALNVYLQSAPDTLLDNPGSPSHVGAFFFHVMDEICQARAADPLRRGCLVCNCINELIGSETPVAKKVGSLMANRKLQVKKLMARAVRTGELAEGTDTLLASKLFMNFLFGLNTFSKTTADEQELRALCEAFLNSLGFYRQQHLNQQVV